MSEHLNDNFVVIPAKGGGALARRSEIAGGRPNGQDGCIIYLRSGPSIYCTASINQIAGFLGAEAAQVRDH